MNTNYHQYSSFKLCLLLATAFFSCFTFSQECPSSNLQDVLVDPVVTEALDTAWFNSNEGQESEKEQCGIIYQCIRRQTVEPSERYFTFIHWGEPPEAVDDACHYDQSLIPREGGVSCNAVAGFHTHPGPASTAASHASQGGDNDHYINETASPSDILTTAEWERPEIIRFGEGPHADSLGQILIQYDEIEADSTPVTDGEDEEGEQTENDLEIEGGLYRPREPSEMGPNPRTFRWRCPDEDRSSGSRSGTSGNRSAGGGTRADPHLKTMDGVLYDLQAVGEFLLVQTKDQKLAVQVRQQAYGKSKHVSVNTAVAVKINSLNLSFYVNNPSQIAINGSFHPFDLAQNIVGSQLKISRHKRQLWLNFPDGSKIWIVYFASYLDVKFFPAKHLAGRLVGLLGNADGQAENDFKTREGLLLKVPLSYEELYQKFAQSWRITQEESLFKYSSNESTKSLTNHNFPLTHFDVKKLSKEDYLAAKQLCEQGGIKDPKILENCILDYGVTGETSFIESAQIEQLFVNQSSAAPIQGLIAHFPLDGNADNVVNSSQHGKIEKAVPTRDRYLTANASMRFNGRAFIKVPVNINPDLHPQLTLSAWVRYHKIQNESVKTQKVISHDNGQYDRTLGIDKRGGGLGWSAFAGKQGVIGYAKVTPGQWQFISVVYNQEKQTALLYVDGQFVSKKAKLGIGETFVHIGGNPNFGARFKGDIDEVKIFDRALSLDELGLLCGLHCLNVVGRE